MPLPASVRSALGSVPTLDKTSTPPTLQEYQPPALGNLSYSQFEFDKSADKLGTGGNAVVYRATVLPDDVTVALKRPFPGKTVPNQTFQELLSEGENWAKVDDHPYIASVFDWGMDGPPWIAVEYLDGGELADRFEEMSLSQRLWTAYALIDAVAYATGQHGLTHHDLHPQNILFQRTPDGVWDVPKIVDWGLSRELIQHTGSVSQAQPEYAAPEHFEALMPDVPVGPHTDVYQLGVVCYELLTESHPDHLRDDVAPPSQVESVLPSEIDSPILKALAHNRNDRTTHPLLFREDVKRVIEQVASAESPTSTTEQSVSAESTDTTTEQQERVDLSTSTATTWPMFQGDSTRTGHHPRVTGPDQPVTAQWTFETGSRVRSSPAVANGTVYIGSYDNSVYALNAADGTTQWRVDTGSSVRSSPAVTNGTVYVGSNNNSIYAIDTSWGTTQWTVDTGGSVRSSPAVANGTVYVGSTDNSVYALNASDGTTRWTVDTAGPVYSSPAVSNGTVYVGSNDNSVYALDENDGAIQWTVDTGGLISSSPAVTNGTVYVGSADDSVYALDANDGTTQWTVDTGRRIVRSSPAVANGTVYVGSNDDSVYAIDATDGTTQWTVDTNGSVCSSPAVANGTVYVGSNDNSVYALNATDGAIQWTVDTGRSIYSSPAVTNGTVYVGSHDNSVYAISER